MLDLLQIKGFGFYKLRFMYSILLRSLLVFRYRSYGLERQRGARMLLSVDEVKVSRIVETWKFFRHNFTKIFTSFLQLAD